MRPTATVKSMQVRSWLPPSRKRKSRGCRQGRGSIVIANGEKVNLGRCINTGVAVAIPREAPPLCPAAVSFPFAFFFFVSILSRSILAPRRSNSDTGAPVCLLAALNRPGLSLIPGNLTVTASGNTATLTYQFQPLVPSTLLPGPQAISAGSRLADWCEYATVCARDVFPTPRSP
jgi:hypothetical protein